MIDWPGQLTSWPAHMCANALPHHGQQWFTWLALSGTALRLKDTPITVSSAADRSSATSEQLRLQRQLG